MNGTKRGSEEISRMKWAQVIKVGAFMLVIPALIFFSVVSFLQTKDAMNPLSKAEVMLFGVNLGLYMPFVFALIFQYGQNVALYLGAHMCSDKVVLKINLGFAIINITEKRIAYGAFWLFCFIDAGTNVVWFYQNAQDNSKTLIALIYNAIMYGAMIIVVWVEEVLGICLQGFSRSYAELQVILRHESKQKKSEAIKLQRELQEDERAANKEKSDGDNNAQPSFGGRPKRDDYRPPTGSTTSKPFPIQGFPQGRAKPDAQKQPGLFPQSMRRPMEGEDAFSAIYED